MFYITLQKMNSLQFKPSNINARWLILIILQLVGHIGVEFSVEKWLENSQTVRLPSLAHHWIRQDRGFSTHVALTSYDKNATIRDVNRFGSDWFGFGLGLENRKYFWRFYILQKQDLMQENLFSTSCNKHKNYFRTKTSILEVFNWKCVIKVRKYHQNWVRRWPF